MISRYMLIVCLPHSCCSNHSPEQYLQYAYFSKALNKLSSSGNYKRTRQRVLTALLFYLYKYSVVCATTISTCPNVHVLFSCPITHPPCFFLKATMPCPCALTSYSFNLCHHVYTMRNYCSLTSSLTLTLSRLFPILLDSKSFQTTLDYSSLYHITSRSCALHLLQTNNIILSMSG